MNVLLRKAGSGISLLCTTALIFVLFLSCNDHPVSVSERDSYIITDAGIAAVFFAQTHVHQPSDDYFGLVSSRDALLKVHVLSPNGDNAPAVNAIIAVGGQTDTITLNGPATLPSSFDAYPGTIQHTTDDCFTGTIPAELVKPGMTVTVAAGDDSITYDSLAIGAPNELHLRMFEISAFQLTTRSWPEGLYEELEQKLPVSNLVLDTVLNVVLPEITVPPTGSAIACRITSLDDYRTITGNNFDQHNISSQQWKAALRDAAGSNFGNMVYSAVAWYYEGSGANKGEGGGFSHVSTLGHAGILLHEAGHGFSLPHWGDNSSYPYKGAMYGIQAFPGVYNETHVGPTWGYDQSKQTFIPPTVQSTSVDGGITGLGTFKKEPMQGGGSGDQEEGFLFRHFSDYSADKMRRYIQNRLVVWNEALGSYAAWDDNAGGYTKVVPNNGVQYPVQRDVSVITVMAGVSSVTPQANIVYQPIGPYTGGLIDLFDPNSSTDREQAAVLIAPSLGCDVTLRITQGGTLKYVMLPIGLDDTLDPTNQSSYKTRAVNLPAADGTVTKVELLSTPDAEVNGVPASPTVLYTWGS